MTKAPTNDVHLTDIDDNLTAISKALTDIIAWTDPLDHGDETEEILKAVHRIATAVHCSFNSIEVARREQE